MFSGLGPMELGIILVIVLVLFGAKRIPEIGSSLGKGIREFKRSISDVDQQIRKPDEQARPVAGLNAGDGPATPMAQDEARPEPKRLIT